jgi:hypothetical protein
MVFATLTPSATHTLVTAIETARGDAPTGRPKSGSSDDGQASFAVSVIGVAASALERGQAFFAPSAND